MGSERRARGAPAADGSSTRAAAPLLGVVVDDGQARTIDGLAMAAAIFGHGRFELIYVDDPTAIPSPAVAPAAGVVVIVDVDRDPNPKQTLAKLTQRDVPVVVLTDGRDQTVAEHARSVGVAACLPTSLPAHEILSYLCDSAESGLTR